MGRGSGESTMTMDEYFARRAPSIPNDACASLPATTHLDHNEDRVLSDTSNGVAAVMDGMGGAAGGEQAAEAAVNAFNHQLGSLPAADDIEGRALWLAEAVGYAAEAVRLEQRTYKSCGTTLAAAVRAGDEALVASVGDTRVYKLAADGRVEQLTEDHDLTTSEEMCKTVGIDPEDDEVKEAIALVNNVESAEEFRSNTTAAVLFRLRNKISRELSSHIGPAAVSRHRMAPGDRLLITSDGIHDNLSPRELQSLIARHPDSSPEELSQMLCLAARRRANGDHLRAKPDDMTATVLA